MRRTKERIVDDLEDDIFALFGSILNRINEGRESQIVITDEEKYKAIRAYARDHPGDKIIFRD